MTSLFSARILTSNIPISIQSPATIYPPAKHHFNGVSVVGQEGPEMPAVTFLFSARILTSSILISIQSPPTIDPPAKHHFNEMPALNLFILCQDLDK